MGTGDDTAINDDEKANSNFPIPAGQRVKRLGMDFYENTLGAPKYVVSFFSQNFAYSNMKLTFPIKHEMRNENYYYELVFMIRFYSQHFFVFHLFENVMSLKTGGTHGRSK